MINNIKLASYNVRNLFDKVDDPLKNDGPPKKESEMLGISEILKKSNADIVALQEIENKDILNDLLKIASLDKKYNVIVGKSDDRGIATALLIDKKFNIKNYSINENNTNFKRPPVEAIVELSPGFEVKVYSIHLKSQRGGVESDIQRQKEAQTLVDMVKNSNIPTILMGDFNDFPNSTVIKTIESNNFKDVRKLDKLSEETKYPTHFSKHVSTLDYIFVSPELEDKVVQNSFNIVGNKENPIASKVSDHRLIEVQLNLEQSIRKALE
ncbi:MAG: endonuclease/exonuclease/phosphatase family protein [Candidatus Calescibacterium sp.]|nr:endonuclease/exonuclease/phosphatase family protein [Candidatus Calescibacterium sp.]MDW8132091.1 endonuclease/exonuclease/phosphatase family protein [Candidatus Calescibacterium sp.]